jgi:hypothetical protein
MRVQVRLAARRKVGLRFAIMLQILAWAVVAGLFVFSAWCLFSAWRLWRRERIESSRPRWRLRRSRWRAS